MTFLPGTLFLIDTSAAARMHHRTVRDTLIGVIDSGLAATCITVDLEAGYSVRKGSDVAELLARRATDMTMLAITESIAQRAREVQGALGFRGKHRSAGPMDLLTAAIAEHYRAIILHYDADFEQISAVTGQRQQWVAPRGSLSTGGNDE